ncbi:ATG3 [[Candida] subhashii]|uniref:Autophagy-related protein 3 n=1 Tax=[Candida] subhashii TaxID=561895 RepID=A0A8J5Q7M9_9ASCO|nr:ATG3 [[Candida] subhashii]KAG7661386.1 ATG3 [[Candida] subhashii]
MFRSKLSSLREYLTPINHSSNFSTTGEISPEEFVKAGDYLVYKFPTWQWSSCPKNLQKSFLPSDKQFLITRHVPSYQRASNYLEGGDGIEEEEEEEIEGEDGEDGWVKSKKVATSHATDKADQAEEIEEEEGKKKDNEEEEPVYISNDIDEFIDETAEDDEDGEEVEDDFEDIRGDSNNSLRKYDLYITYSTSYRVPKMYLVGFDSNGIPLLPKQMFEDINSDYKDKTVTIENLPVAYNTTSISIHPCRHASVMKVLMKHSKLKKQKEEGDSAQELEERTANLSVEDRQVTEEEEQPEGIRVDQYLIIFLKFIASVTPGIEYDYTMDAL